MANDPYTTLGVSRNASAEDIKKAYRKLAHKYHPDKKGGDEARFKEINEAYQILSDHDKKARFDQFGHAGAPFGSAQDFAGASQGFAGFDFGGIGDIFDMFSGGASGRGRARPEKGEDLHLQVTISPADAGKRKVYEFEAFDSCATCKTTGVAPGSKMTSCATCNGQGRVRQTVRTPFGTFAQVMPCSTCEGEGQFPEMKCSACGGTGRMKTKRKLEVHVPKDMPERYLMAFPRGGNAGMNGTPPGDLALTLQTR